MSNSHLYALLLCTNLAKSITASAQILEQKNTQKNIYRKLLYSFNFGFI